MRYDGGAAAVGTSVVEVHIQLAVRNCRSRLHEILKLWLCQRWAVQHADVATICEVDELTCRHRVQDLAADLAELWDQQCHLALFAELQESRQLKVGLLDIPVSASCCLRCYGWIWVSLGGGETDRLTEKFLVQKSDFR